MLNHRFIDLYGLYYRLIHKKVDGTAKITLASSRLLCFERVELSKAVAERHQQCRPLSYESVCIYNIYVCIYGFGPNEFIDSIIFN